MEQQTELDGRRAPQSGTGEFTSVGITTYRVDPEQLDDFVSTVHGDKLQQMGDEIGPMTCGYLLQSRVDPEIVIHLTFVHIEDEQDVADSQALSTHPLRLAILEETIPLLKAPPELGGYDVLSELQYKR